MLNLEFGEKLHRFDIVGSVSPSHKYPQDGHYLVKPDLSLLFFQRLIYQLDSRETRQTHGAQYMTDDKSQAAHAYRQMEESIVTLKLKPGEAITENYLTQKFGVGRTPIREAIQRLSWEGLLVIRPRLGIMIAEMNPSDFAKVLDARHALERLVAGLAARLASRPEREALEVCAESMRDAASEPDVEEFLRLDKVFDEIVATAACNPFAAKALVPLQTQSRRFWFRHFGQADLNPAAWNHLELMQAIAAGDEQEAMEKAENLMFYLRRQASALTAGPSGR